MAIRTLRYEGDEILKKKSREITGIDDRIKEKKRRKSLYTRLT